MHNQLEHEGEARVLKLVTTLVHYTLYSPASGGLTDTYHVQICDDVNGHLDTAYNTNNQHRVN